MLVVAVGGALVLALLIVFAVSALIHEYVFAISLGRIQGYQTAFFLLHGGAVALSLRWRPRGALAFPSVVATLLFNLVSGTLFFASWCQMMSWYSAAAPAWLSGRIWGG